PYPPPLFPADWRAARWRVGERLDGMPPRTQPVVKLHGSVQWATADNDGLLVIGGAKGEAIAQAPLLAWYHGQFVERISQPDARLMVIGYGFGDEPINAAMHSALANGLKLFIVDGAGFDAIDGAGRFAVDLRAAAIGGSPRLLRDIFGGDAAELQKLHDFL